MAATEHAAKFTPGVGEKPVEFGAQNTPLSCQLLPSFSEARKLVNSAYSCLVVKTHRRPLALSPRFLNKKRSGIQEQLNGELLKYSSRLQGVPLAYDNVQIVGEFGDIQDDVGYIHLNIQADFVIFQPKCGEKLVGVVNKLAPSHIGCLVHGCFNASVPRPFRMPVEAWQYIGLKVGDHMEFEVFRLDSDAVGVFCIRGRMDKEIEADATERLNEATKEQISDVPSANSERAAIDVSNNESKVIPEDTPKRKAKKRALQETNLHNSLEDQEGSREINMTVDEVPKKKSKKKKHQETESQPVFSEVDASIGHAEDSFYQSDKNISKRLRKMAKRHASLGVDIDNNIQVEESSILGLDNTPLISSNQEQTKKSKKKKHKHHSDQELNDSLQNGVTEEPAFMEHTVLGDLRAEDATVLENLKKKHKKKHKRSSDIADSTLESINGADLTSQESLLDDLPVHQETPKQKKQKRKHPENVLAESDVAYLAEDRNLLPADSQEFAETKTKKKRKK